MFLHHDILSFVTTKESIMITEEEILEKIKIFGKTVRKIRESRGITIKELSEKTGSTEQYVIKIENGTARKMSVSRIFDISRGLGVSPYELCENI